MKLPRWIVGMTLAGLVLLIAAPARATCTPSNAPLTSIGCMPQLVPQSTDILYGWRPGLFPTADMTLSVAAILNTPGSTYYLPQSSTDTVNVGAVQINGANGLNIFGGVTAPFIFIGPGAGASAPNNTSSGLSMGIGAYALQNMTVALGEDTAFGQWACRNVISSQYITCIGTNALGNETTGGTDTVIGSDSGRNMVGSSGMTGIGQASTRNGAPTSGVAIGQANSYGNGGGFVLTGTLTNGDVISDTLSSSYAGITGFPFTVSHTVAGGDTLATIAANLAAQIVAKSAGGPNNVFLSASVSGHSGGPATVGLDFPGTSTTGWAITQSTLVTGSATETITTTNGYVGTGNIVLGTGEFEGYGATSTANNILIGTSLAPWLTTGSANVMIGGGASMTTANNNDCIGLNSCNSITIGDQNQVYGQSSLTNLTTGGDNIVIGNNIGNTIVTGNDNILICTGSDPCPGFSAGANFLVEIAGQFFLNNANAAGSVPVVTSCGTNSVESHSNDHTGMISITAGSPASCTITFAAAYNSWNHCRVTSQTTLAAFGYSYSVSAITVTGTALSGKLDYECDGY